MKDPTFASTPWSDSLAFRVRIEESQPYSFPLPIFPTEQNLDAKSIREPAPPTIQRPTAATAKKPSIGLRVLHRSDDYNDNLCSLLDTDSVILLTTPVIIPASPTNTTTTTTTTTPKTPGHNPTLIKSKPTRPPPSKPKTKLPTAPTPTPSLSKPPTIQTDPFEPLGRSLARRHSRIRHVPYIPSLGKTPCHDEFLSRARGLIIVVCEPQQQQQQTQTSNPASTAQPTSTPHPASPPHPASSLSSQLALAADLASTTAGARASGVPSVLLCYCCSASGEGFRDAANPSADADADADAGVGVGCGERMTALLRDCLAGGALEDAFSLVVLAGAWDGASGAVEEVVGVVFEEVG